MSKKSKFFRVAVEGATTDGRKIEKSWLQQMAANFNPEKYGARIWMEHIRGVLPESSFRAYGDVTALKAEEVEIDGHKRLALFAQIDPTDDLIAMVKKRQKIYTSMEIDEKFAGTGEAYLMGLGITDSPASLGTEMLTFASQNPEASPFKHRKQKADNLFSVGTEVTIEFEEEEGETFAEKVKGILAKFTKDTSGQDKKFNDILSGMEQLADEIVQAHGKFAASAELTKVKGDLESLTNKFNELHAKLEKTPNTQTVRPPATGQDGVQTDC